MLERFANTAGGQDNDELYEPCSVCVGSDQRLCVADTNQNRVLTFDAKVVDVSLDGTGILVSDPALPLCAGTRLEGARIRHPQHQPIEVDLEVRYVSHVRLPSGERATRIGCKIVSSPQNLEELIRLFIIDLQ